MPTWDSAELLIADSEGLLMEKDILQKKEDSYQWNRNSCDEFLPFIMQFTIDYSQSYMLLWK